MGAAIDLGLLDLQLPALAPGTKILVAFSGGLDSSVLLHRLAMQAPNRVHAIHIHHGLQAAADAWATQCAEACAKLQIPFSRVHVQVDSDHAAGPEGAARQARYDALRSLMSAGDCLATAHHRDDQAETVLLRLLRGTGVQGLGGMRALSEFTPGWLWRPLLEVPRAELRRYAEVQGLHWIDDPHNVDPRYARSWLRAEVLPLLQRHFPQAQGSLVRVAQLAEEASGLLDELAAQDSAVAARGDALSVASLLQMSTPRRHNLLRFWLREHAYEVPSANELARIGTEVLAAAPDTEPRLAWAGCELRRYRDLLFAMAPLPPPPPSWLLTWTEGCQLQLPDGCGWLEAARVPAPALTVRAPRAGEAFRPAGGAHARALKNLFQEAGVPPWVRVRTPVIETDDGVAVVAGIGCTQRWQAQRQSVIGALHWRHSLCGAASPLAL